MKPIIKHTRSGGEFFTPENCYITELSNSVDDPDVSIARARVEPGVTTQWHKLKYTAERYCVLSGIGRVEIGGRPPQEIGPGDVVLIPPQCPQRVTNITDEDLIFLAICTPRFLSENYQDVEKHPNIGQFNPL